MGHAVSALVKSYVSTITLIVWVMTKKQCKCGAANCSGFLGEKPKAEKVLSEKSKMKKKKRKKKNKLVHDDDCFSCGDGGELLLCDRNNCTKAYHQDCLIMDDAPKGKWSCPWHFCDECGKTARSMCSLCPNSFCATHLEGQMKELSEDVLVCPAHSEEELASLTLKTTEDSKLDTAVEEEVLATVPPKKKRRKSVILEGKENIVDVKTPTSKAPNSVPADNHTDLKDVEKKVPEMSTKRLAIKSKKVVKHGSSKVSTKKTTGKKKLPLKQKKEASVNTSHMGKC